MDSRGSFDLSALRKATPDDVRAFHNNSDVDSGVLAQHHTLGSKSYQAAAGDHKHLGARVVTLGATGPWASSVPGSATSGSPVTVEVPGVYVVTMQASGFATAVGTTYFELYVDGVNIASGPFYFNQTGVHLTGPRIIGSTSLTKGTHYVYVRHFFGGAASDGGDYVSVQFILSKET